MIIVLTCVQFEVFNESNYSRALNSSDFGHKIKTMYTTSENTLSSPFLDVENDRVLR